MSTQHMHTWTGPTDTGAWTCTSCLETSPTCAIHRPSDDEDGHPTGTSLGICNPCLRAEQRVLDDITDALGHYQRPTTSVIKAIRYDRDKLHRNGRAKTDTRPLPEQLRDLADHVTTWADMWSDQTGDTPPALPIAWLKTRLLWAAQNPDPSAWDDYRSEIRTIRHTARRLAGLLPKRQAGPCVHCGGDVVRDWADEHWQPRKDGLSDQLRCTGCGITWRDHDHWQWVNGTTIRVLPETHPDAHVTLEQAKKIYPDVPASTWRTWTTDRGQLTPTGTDVRDRPLYRLDHISAVVQRRADTTRAGRRAG